MNPLNDTAWTRWVEYRKSISKPLKPFSLEAAKLKLQGMGDESVQAAIVEQSIAGQWQGLFELKDKDQKKKADEPARLRRQQNELEGYNRESSRHWEQDTLRNGPIAKLRLAAAYMARHPTPEPWFKIAVTELIKQADPAAILGDPELYRLVLILFSTDKSARGVERLMELARG